MSLSSLFPLHGIVITLRFSSSARLPFFHQPIVTAWLRHLLDSPGAYEQYITIDTPESGCTDYRRGDYYRFSVLVLPGGVDMLQALLDKLKALPDSVSKRDKSLPLRNNLLLENLTDLFSGKPIRDTAGLRGYDEVALNNEANLWQYAPACRIRWLSPVRLLLEKSARGENYKDEARFCRRGDELPFALLRTRLYDSVNALLRGRGEDQRIVAETVDTPHQVLHSQVFWLDYSYRNEAKQRDQPMGGLLGEIEVETTGFSAQDWRLWVLGQYLGIGQRRVFGWGRYALESLDGDMTLQRPAQATTLLKRTADKPNLHTAYQIMRDNVRDKPPRISEEEDDWWLDDDALCELEDEPGERLQRLGKQLRNNTYQPAELRGVILKKPGKNPRALAIPPFFDRVAQRAVAQILTPALDTLMYHGSFGYRHGRSRHTAKIMIQQAYQDGYRWVFESDIDDFFDTGARAIPPKS